ncbi:rhodanese-like domain-containing protein [Marinithermus hydrothermalis]|nr:rhodanese-like domain-containing protein [Marinithermus hydrothermalis]
MPRALDPHTAYHLLDRFQIVDVREPEEWAEGVLPEALRLPLSHLEALAPLRVARERPVLLYCRSGNRSREAAQTLARLGHRQVWHLEGGLTAWRAAGLPCIPPS